MSHGFLCYSNYLHCSIVTQTTGQAFLVVLDRIAGLSVRTVPRKHGLLTKFVWSRWLGTALVLFFCKFMDLDFVSVHKHAKKELGQYPAILTSHLVNKPYVHIDWQRHIHTQHAQFIPYVHSWYCRGLGPIFPSMALALS